MSLEKRSLPPLTVDCVVFGYDGGKLKIALIERKIDPFKEMRAIPCCFMEDNETAEETGIENIFLEQFHTFSSHGRDHRGAFINIFSVGSVVDFVFAA